MVVVGLEGQDVGEQDHFVYREVRWEGSMEARVGKERANKKKIDQRLIIIKIDCNTMLINTRLGVRFLKKNPSYGHNDQKYLPRK